MLPAPAIGKRRALVGLQRGNFRVREDRLDLVARGQRSSRARRRGKSRDTPVTDALHRLERAVARHMAVEAVVGKELKLRQRPVLRMFHQLARLLERQNHIGLRARRQFQFAAVFPDALVTFFAHGVRHDDDSAKAEQL